MTLDEYQAAALRTVNARLDDEDRLMDAASGLAEEAGEVLAHVRKHRFQGRALDKEAVILELGDALWCLTIVASSLGVSLADVGTRNVEKLSQRHGTRDKGPAAP
jgi:NTP pyrophosphatase (non-canonical NTP hydrolase)